MNPSLEICCPNPEMFFCYGNPKRELAVWVCQECQTIQCFSNSTVNVTSYPNEIKMIQKQNERNDLR